jgi:cobalt-zinc-cadmium efflux system protein
MSSTDLLATSIASPAPPARPAHGHDHGHGHSHAPRDFGRAFAVGMALNLGFVALEATFGYLAGSLALVADAGHNLSDVLGLAMAWGAARLARRQSTPRRTYGMRRSTVLAALANAVVLLVAVGGIAWEAVRRLSTPSPVATATVMAVAALGVAVNAATAWLFFSGRRSDLNVRGAFLHMAADAAISLGVVAAGAAIAWTGWNVLDPLTSLGIAAVVVWGTWGLLRDALNLALDAVPEGIELEAVRDYLLSVPPVREAHHLHIWGLSTTETAMTAHVVVGPDEPPATLLAELHRGLHDRFGIEHATLQVENSAEPGCAAPDC